RASTGLHAQREKAATQVIAAAACLVDSAAALAETLHRISFQPSEWQFQFRMALLSRLSRVLPFRPEPESIDRNSAPRSVEEAFARIVAARP
ncbi:hypothetical protein ABTM62_19285, partial [Acinetobacter baumannii]